MLAFSLTVGAAVVNPGTLPFRADWLVWESKYFSVKVWVGVSLYSTFPMYCFSVYLGRVVKAAKEISLPAGLEDIGFREGGEHILAIGELGLKQGQSDWIEIRSSGGERCSAEESGLATVDGAHGRLEAPVLLRSPVGISG